MNTSFKHFIFFVTEFNLVDKKELAPLQELIDRVVNRHNDVYSQQQHASSSNAGDNNYSQLAGLVSGDPTAGFKLSTSQTVPGKST